MHKIKCYLDEGKDEKEDEDDHHHHDDDDHLHEWWHHHCHVISRITMMIAVGCLCDAEATNMLYMHTYTNEK